MAERCRLCGVAVTVADAAHVLLNAPETGLRDYYVCSVCFEESVESVFDAERAPGGSADPDGRASGDSLGGDDPAGAK